MKIALGIIISLLCLISVIQGASFWANHDASDNFNSLVEFKMRVADALDSIKKDKKISSSADSSRSPWNRSTIGMNSSSSAIYPSDICLNGLNSSESGPSSDNQSSENATKSIQPKRDSIADSATLSSGLDLSQRIDSSPSSVNFYNQGTFKGIWSIEARKHEIGSSRINDRMILSGDFGVQKRLSFSD